MNKQQAILNTISGKITILKKHERQSIEIKFDLICTCILKKYIGWKKKKGTLEIESIVLWKIFIIGSNRCDGSIWCSLFFIHDKS